VSKLRVVLPPSLLALAVASACAEPPGHGHGSRPAVPPQSSATAPGSAAQGTARESLPPGVLAQVQGVKGVIRVEERDGLRMLTIDGVVQGALPLSGAVGEDPVAGLVRASRPRATTALVIGLGTGKTAADLARAGLNVAVVELEPKVIELARRYFDYRGHAVAGEGFAYLRANPKRYDVVVMDAFSRTEPPAEMNEPGSLALLSTRTTTRGLTLLRLFAEPTERLLKDLRLRLTPPDLGRGDPYQVAIYAAGFGTEPQTLVVAGTAGRHPTLDERVPQLEPARLKTDTGPDSKPPPPPGSATTRHVDLQGYLIRLKGGELALDLPHWEMGAQRYLLEGAEGAKLAKLVTSHRSFPTSGDIHSDGDTSATLREALGGGGFQRSDVRFSPVAVSLEGDAKLLARVHPDRALRVPRSIRGPGNPDPRLPYGGALYELTVTQVHWTLDRRRWIQLTAQLRPHLAKAAKQIHAGQLGKAGTTIDLYLTAFRKQLAGASFVFVGNLGALSTALAKGSTKLGQGPSAYAQARQCDQVLGTELQNLWTAPRDITRLRTALFACATTRYRATADRGAPALRKWAAARLIEVLAFRDPAGLTDIEASERAEKRADAVQARFPDVAPLSELPPLKPVGSPPSR